MLRARNATHAGDGTPHSSLPAHPQPAQADTPGRLAWASAEQRACGTGALTHGDDAQRRHSLAAGPGPELHRDDVVAPVARDQGAPTDRSRACQHRALTPHPTPPQSVRPAPCASASDQCCQGEQIHAARRAPRNTARVPQRCMAQSERAGSHALLLRFIFCLVLWTRCCAPCLCRQRSGTTCASSPQRVKPGAFRATAYSRTRSNGTRPCVAVVLPRRALACFGELLFVVPCGMVRGRARVRVLRSHTNLPAGFLCAGRPDPWRLLLVPTPAPASLARPFKSIFTIFTPRRLVARGIRFRF